MDSEWWPIIIAVVTGAVLIATIVVAELLRFRRVRRWRADYERRGGLAGDLSRRRRRQPRLPDNRSNQSSNAD